MWWIITLVIFGLVGAGFLYGLVRSKVDIANERRDRVIALFNNFGTAKNEFWRDLNELAADWNSTTKNEKNAKLDKLRTDLRQIDVFGRIGIYPALVAAVNEYKVAGLATIEYFENLDIEKLDWSNNDRAELGEVKKRLNGLNAIDDKVHLELNRIASEIGGINVGETVL